MKNLYKFEEEEKKVIEKNPIPMIIYQYSDKGLIPLLFSKGALSFFRLDKKELYNYVAFNMGSLTHPDDSAKLYSIKKALYENIPETIDLDYRILLPGDKEYTWIKVSGYVEPIGDNNYLCYFHYLDTSSIHKSEERIQQILDTEDSQRNFNDNTSIKSFINKALSNAQFQYAIYDIEQKELVNGNLYDNILKHGAAYPNYPELLFEMKIHPEEERAKILNMIKSIIEGKNFVEGSVSSYNFKEKKYYNVKITMNAILDDFGVLKYILTIYESLNTINEVFSMSQNTLSKNGLITWNYIIADDSYNLDTQKYETAELRKNANLIFSAIRNNEIKVPLNMIYNRQKTLYDIITLRNESNKINKFEVTYTLINDQNHEPLSILGVARDITKYYEMEKDYIKKLEKANIAKAGFLARLSHDMRTPLGAIVSLSEFGIEECTNTLSREYFKKINDNSSYLLSFISDVLAAKKINNDNLTLQNNIFLICETFKQILSVVQQRALEKSISLNYDFDFCNSDIYLKADEKKIKQLTINLLNNSIKYTQKNGIVDFIVTTKKKDNRLKIDIVINDNGVGMSDEFQNHMFDEYSQEPNTLSFEEEGTGLGLSIVKKTVDLLDGTIKCDSKLKRGTKFTISILCNIATKEEIATLKKRLNKEKLDLLIGKRVLLCEDKAINILIINKILESVGIITDTVENGIDGINKVKENNYDLILMDIRMPVMDGLTATKEIRKINSKIPIIALSANANQEDIEESIQSGMNYHLSKPVDRQKLYETLIKYIILSTN